MPTGDARRLSSMWPRSTRTNAKEVARAALAHGVRAIGSVLYVHEGALLAQTFDVDRRLTGQPRTVADGLDYYRSTGAAAFSVSDTGVLAYHGGGGPQELAWFDRRGTFLGPVGNLQWFGNIRSPDGERSRWR